MNQCRIHDKVYFTSFPIKKPWPTKNLPILWYSQCFKKSFANWYQDGEWLDYIDTNVLVLQQISKLCIFFVSILKMFWFVVEDSFIEVEVWHAFINQQVFWTCNAMA